LLPRCRRSLGRKKNPRLKKRDTHSLPDLSALHESGIVKVLGRLHDYPMDARRQQASEKRQGTKSREGDGGRCSGLWGISVEATGSDGDFLGEQLAGATAGKVGAGVWKVGKRVEGLLDVYFGGGLKGDEASGIAAGRMTEVGEGWLCGEQFEQRS
jgi:hypothetical protein